MLAKQLHCALHHLTTESSTPVLAAGSSPLDVAAGALAGAPAALELSSAATEDGERKGSERFAAGSVVRIIARAEQWLRGRCGRVCGWDDATGRCMVTVPAQPGELPVFDENSLADRDLSLMLLPKFLEKATEIEYENERTHAAGRCSLWANAAT